MYFVRIFAARYCCDDFRWTHLRDWRLFHRRSSHPPSPFRKKWLGSPFALWSSCSRDYYVTPYFVRSRHPGEPTTAAIFVLNLFCFPRLLSVHPIHALVHVLAVRSFVLFFLPALSYSFLLLEQRVENGERFHIMFAIQLIRCPFLNPRIRGVTNLSGIIEIIVRNASR